jgi:beta-galactosidase
MANSDVWINGQPLGHRPYGYVSFRYELTSHLNFGPEAMNVIAVRTDTSAQPASRWYTGAGIYRHVRLVRVNPVHFEYHSVFLSTPAIHPTSTTVRVQARIVNTSDIPREVQVFATLLGPPQSAPDGRYAVAGKSDVLSVQAGAHADLKFDVLIPWQTWRWDVDHPHMHLARVRLQSSGEPLDEELVPFGIREAQFTPDRGFVLNGRKVLLKGVCLHHDGGAVGAAVPLSIWERRLEALKEYGCNAIRTAHNPVAPEFLDLCDRMGFLVMDEFFDCWTIGKNRYDYHLYFEEWSLRDLRDTVRRDRNHPSVIIYSAGNEIRDTPKPELAKRILAGLVNEYHRHDPTRPTTQGLFRPNVSGDYTNGLADLLDVVGTNYRDQELLAAQRAKPERKIVGTEQRHELSTWLNCRDYPSHSGQFLWTGIDYLGEARHWPRNAFASGLLDRTGLPKPRAFQRQSWWSDKPMVHVVRRIRAEDVLPEDPGYGGEERFTQVTFSDWTPRNLEPHNENMEVYSNCEEVELFLNGRSLGTQNKPEDDSPRGWKIDFEPGKLEAVARSEGEIVARHTLQTAGKAARVELVADRQDTTTAWDDVVFVRATITDSDGIRVPRAADTVTFTIDGPGQIIAVDNGDCMSIEPFQGNQRKAYAGTCIAILRATAQGPITITATANGLTPGSAVLTAKAEGN